MSLNKVKIEVASTEYTINTTDSQERVLSIAKTLDEGVKEILEAAPSASITAALVLNSINILDKLDRANHSADNMRMQIREYIEDANTAKFELEKVKQELEKYRVEIQMLKQQKGNNERKF